LWPKSSIRHKGAEMKRNIILLMVGVLTGLCLMTYSLMAETISGTGISQKALVSFLTNVITIGNEVKTDHNTLFANYTGSLATNRQMLTAQANVFNSYTTFLRQAIVQKNFSTAHAVMLTRSIPSGSVSRSVPATPSATTAASALSLSGH